MSETQAKYEAPSAPRLTEGEILSKVLTEQYHVFPGTTMTVCCLTLKNGYAVTGESACVSPENFDEATGRHLAYGAAVRKVWDLEGYLLRQRVLEGKAHEEGY